jgi:hypothetical protein
MMVVVNKKIMITRAACLAISTLLFASGVRADPAYTCSGWTFAPTTFQPLAVQYNVSTPADMYPSLHACSAEAPKQQCVSYFLGSLMSVANATHDCEMCIGSYMGQGSSGADSSSCIDNCTDTACPDLCDVPLLAGVVTACDINLPVDSPETTTPDPTSSGSMGVLANSALAGAVIIALL